MFGEMKVATRSLMGVGAVLVMMVGMGWYDTHLMQMADDSDTELYEHALVPTSQVGNFTVDFYRAWVHLNLASTEQDQAGQREHLAEVAHWRDEATRELENAATSIVAPDLKSELAQLNRVYAETRRLWADAEKEIAVGHGAAVLASMNHGDLSKNRLALRDINDVLRSALMQSGKARSDLNTVLADGAIRFNWILMALATLMAVAVGVYLFRKINGIINTIVSESSRLTHAAQEGSLQTRADVDRIDPEFRGVLSGLNDTLDAVVTPLNVAADYVARISKGDIPPTITADYKGDFNTIKTNLNALITTLDTFSAAQAEMSRQHGLGALDADMPAASFEGTYRRMAEGVNALVKSHIAVKMRVVEVVSRYAVGDFSVDMDRLPGQKAKITAAIDNVKKSLRDVAGEIMTLSKAATQGQLSTRADTSRFQHEFKEMVAGINSTLDAVVGPLKVAAECVERISKGDIPQKITDNYNGDFNEIKNNLNRCIEAVNLLVTDAGLLVTAAVEGKLDTRADATRHLNDFRKIVDGVNHTLDAVLAPINESAGVLEKLSQRDLRARVKGEYKGDHARIKESVNATADALHDALAQVAEAVDQVSSASSQIAASSQSVAEGASEQASSLEETSSSLESMASMTKQSADNAQQATGLASNARTAAKDGGHAMEQMVGAMQKIRAASEGTSQIIKDINEIAFQTNLLALNAAVEAARAGDAGRGFAVVAEEVRSLALRSKEAAQKTEALIKESVKQAGEGESISREVNAKLVEIGGAVGKVSDIVAEMAAAAKEQSQGIEQVNKAVGQMGKVTQQSAANSEESSSAAAELSGQSEELAAMVGAFQLNRQAGRKVAAKAIAMRSKASTQGKNGKSNGHGGIPLKPEEIIPLEDDNVLQEF